jgi:heme/copper-type cytochrome/quinol oxidase subunit 2
VQGTASVAATADGREYSSLAPDNIAHTFTIPQLGVNVPLPGDGMNGQAYNTVTFTFRTGAAGTYTFRCLDPCGTGPMGMMGPMMTQGYMLGTLTVQ